MQFALHEGKNPRKQNLMVEETTHGIPTIADYHPSFIWTFDPFLEPESIIIFEWSNWRLLGVIFENKQNKLVSIL